MFTVNTQNKQKIKTHFYRRDIFYYLRILSLSLSLSLSLLISPLVFANQNPRSLAADHRIKKVSYNPNDVVTIHGNHLIDTVIQFGQDEQIVDVHVGDPLAWEVDANKNMPFVLFIKPKLLESDTNMSVSTHKRLYHFHLMTSATDTPRSQNLTYSLVFAYPEEDQARLTEQFSIVQQNFLGTRSTIPQHWNFNYAFCGAKNIAPIQAVDNGAFTVFKFPKNSVIPAIFAVDKYRHESLINFRVQNDYVFIQGVGHQYTLRNGQDVTTVYNDSFAY